MAMSIERSSREGTCIVYHEMSRQPGNVRLELHTREDGSSLHTQIAAVEVGITIPYKLSAGPLVKEAW